MSPIEIIILLIAVTVGIYLYFTRNFNYWEERNVPHKKPSFLFGNMFDVVVGREVVDNFFAKLYNEFKGPYFGIFGMDAPFLVLKDPVIIKRIFVTDYEIFAEKTFLNNDAIDPVFSKVLFTLSKPNWTSIRSKLSTLFTSGNMKMVAPHINNCVDNMLEYIENRQGQPVNIIKDVTFKYASDVIATSVFGVQLNSFSTNNDFFNAGSAQFSGKYTRTIQPLAYVFAHPLVRLLNLKFVHSELGKYMKGVFDKNMLERETSSVVRNDLLDKILLLKNQFDNQESFKLDPDKLAAHATIFYVAGTDSVSNTIALSLLELAMHTDVQDRLRKEIMDVISKHGDITYEAIQDMKYLQMVISETLRLYPFTAFLHRRCLAKYSIPETGLVLKPGDKIIVPLQAIHRDPQYYPEPLKYDPERFNEINSSKRQEGTYLPFSTGPRTCLGKRLAYLNMQLAIANVVKNFRIAKDLSTKYPLAFGISFMRLPVDKIELIFNKL